MYFLFLSLIILASLDYNRVYLWFPAFLCFEKVFTFPMVACLFIVMMKIRIRQFHLMSAMHKLCCTKLNSDKMPSQIYSWSAVLSSVILFFVHVNTYIITTAYFIVSMHACSQWLEWCLGIFIVIAAYVSLLSSFQLTSPPGKLFKDKFLNTFCRLIVSL